MEYYSPTLRNEVVIHVIKWRNLENMSSKKKPVTKTTFYEMSSIEKPIEV
jgi:hypothetical protein